MLWERSERDFRTHQAVASVATGLAVTLPDLRVAVHPGEAWQAGAGVAPLACVQTRGPVGTGFVMGAVIQICKQTGGNMTNCCCFEATEICCLKTQRRFIYEDHSFTFLLSCF